MNLKSVTSIKDIILKLEHYCSYQERCHLEVINKLFDFTITTYEKDEIVVHLIQNNYLNEERYASIFTISKFHQKKWGKVRIVNELKARKISSFLIAKSINEIGNDEYYESFELISEKIWHSTAEKNSMKKRKKFCDYLLRKGWESELIYTKVKELEKN